MIKIKSCTCSISIVYDLNPWLLAVTYVLAYFISKEFVWIYLQNCHVYIKGEK
jgi:hypothetical protein